MSNFKAGDRVKRLNYSQGNFEVGQVGTVASCDYSSKRVVLEGDKPGFCHDPANLSLVVEPRRFQVGDKVKRINGTSWSSGGYYVLGSVFTISSVDGDGDVYDPNGKVHGQENVELVTAVDAQQPRGPFKVGDTVRRRKGVGENAGVAEGEVFEVTEVSSKNGWVRGPKSNVWHNADYIEAATESSIVQTVTSTYVAAGSFTTKQSGAQIRWEESDDEQVIEVNIPGQECTAGELREFAKVLNELADKLDATKR